MYIPLTFEGALQQCLSVTTGGTEGYYISGNDQYKFHLFTSSGDLIVDRGTISNVDLYVVGGGGGGAAGGTYAGGGGGGGVEPNTKVVLYRGTYNIVIGNGGAGGNNSVSPFGPGSAGSASTFIGPNLNIIANGGGGGDIGNLGRGGTSGNGFIGGLNRTNNGGGGGGATANGEDASSTAAGDGGSGVAISNTNYSSTYTYSYGCGGGGAANSSGGGAAAYSCNDFFWGAGGVVGGVGNPGTKNYGMGGGASSTTGGGTKIGSSGGSGVVIVKYKVNDYCKDYFDETGSCGCEQVVLDITPTSLSGFEPIGTGSFIYTPCGQTGFASASLNSNFPETICVTSGSMVWYNYDREDNGVVEQGRVYVYDQNNNFAACISASYGIETCTTQSVPTSSCSQEKIVTFYASGSGGPVTAKYFPAHSSSFHFESIPANNVRYRCVQSGSVSQLGTPAFYPIEMSGSSATGIIYFTASCNTIQITSATGRGIITYCNSGSATLINPSIGSTYCIDSSVGVRPVTGFSLFSYNTLGSCLSGSFDTASCGC